ncbi:MAG: anthranilate phosphoribosyltransferase [Actinobacteria bacterium]|nr:anthranilate phosphoribosyltransferase [Actinomycetota bacterium]MBW3650272.1 anthranilate phosphoribosyltransferase [Actinomycetota bacterium]
MNQVEDFGGWPTVLGRLLHGADLSGDEAGSALASILEGRATSAQIAAFITLIHAKGETVEEMAGLVRTLLDYAEPIVVAADVVDTCGSGGSAQRRAGAFNVSTIASFVVAGAGAPVAKHGGRAASATSSSADLLTTLGVSVELGPEGVAHCVEEAGMGFCFAPRFHPAMRHAAPTRRELGIPTLFNFIAPLANPARPRRQVVGVSDPSLADKMLSVLQRNGATSAMVVYGHDGLDELTTTTTSTVLELRDGEVRSYPVEPAALGLPTATPDQLRGGDAAANAELARRILDGEAGAHRDIVLLNAAAGVVVAGLAENLTEGLVLAATSLDEGRAGEVLDRLVAASQAAAQA